MTKQELEQIKSLKNEIRLLAEDIHSYKPQIVSDVVTGCTPTRNDKHVITITGVDTKTTERLYGKLNIKLERLQTELAELEDWIDTIEDAIQTEYDMVDYASRTQPVSGLSTYRVKCNKRIKELEDIHERGIRKANGSDICAGSKGRLRYGGI